MSRGNSLAAGAWHAIPIFRLLMDAREEQCSFAGGRLCELASLRSCESLDVFINQAVLSFTAVSTAWPHNLPGVWKSLLGSSVQQ
jgi:hypothetical protein